VPNAVPTFPVVDDTSVTFALADRGGRLTGVCLAHEIGVAGPLDFARIPSGWWRLRLPLPDVDRMEYLFEVADQNGNRATVTDPANPRRAPGAFGEKSVVEFAGYRAPAWLATEPIPGRETEVRVAAPDLDGELAATLWTPSGLEAHEPAPLLVVHDGPEYAALGGLTHYLGVSIASGALPPVRAALVDPGDRNAWYSANPAYPPVLATLLTELEEVAPATVRVGVGVSLGGLALLHAHRTEAGAFDALLLQSGSFFTTELDPQESGFSGFAAVTALVAEVHAATSDPHPVPTVLTCGNVEENLANNVEMAATLRRLGYATELVEVRDAHNFTAWRDALDPHLTKLITDLVCARAA
jgi:enterochelin esterase family protein